MLPAGDKKNDAKGKTIQENTLQTKQGKQGKGLHTTTHLEMFPLANGGAIVDTPGIREFGLWDVDEEDMALFFPEFRNYWSHI